MPTGTADMNGTPRAGVSPKGRGAMFTSPAESAEDALSIPIWLRGLTELFGPNTCIVTESGSLSFTEVDSRSDAIARGLLARGIGKGTRVGLLFGNGAEWVAWWAAVEKIGALCIPLSTFSRPAELARLVRHSDLHLLGASRSFLGRDFVKLVADAFPSLCSAQGPELALADAPYLRTVVFDEPGPQWSRDVEWIVRGGQGDRWQLVLEQARQEVHPEDDALCIYTSGQSAEPKGALFTHRAIIDKTHYLRDMFGFDESTVTDVTLPFFWVGGLVMALFPTMAAGGVTRCTQRSTLGSNAVIRDPATGSARSATAMPGMRLVPALGMTETFGMYSWGTEPPSGPYSIAAPLDEFQPGFEVRLAEEQTITDDGRGACELLVRGPTLTTRLHKVSRGAVFTADGFYHTGDLAVHDDGGRLRFVGRLNDIIKTSGANVSPVEVERELNNIEGVEVGYVVGLPDADRGQVVAAAVVPVGGVDLTAEAIKDALRERLSPYKVPKIVVFLESAADVPMTPSSKVLKRDLAELIEGLRHR
jgi:acyl-CoA synthetase (AMP-forming)/AMP-acid ligase II